METVDAGSKLIELENTLREYRLWWDEIIRADDGRKEHAQGALFMVEKIETLMEPVFAEMEALRDSETGVCVVCWAVFEQNTGRGRKRDTCSPACRQKKARKNKINTARAKLPKQARLI